jgi:prepilin-type N-terminal cleavage/methylation domain-containing protein
MRSRGFTLIEMLVVMTISAILVAMAIPTFERMLRSSRVSSAANSLLAALDVARSEAIRRNVVVTVCRSLNPDAPVGAVNCSSAADANYPENDWASGWIVVAKSPANANNAIWQAGDELVLRQAAFQPPQPVRLTILTTLVNPQVYSYGSNGLKADGLLGFTASVDYRDLGTPHLADSGLARCLTVIITGRAAVTRPPAAGIC